MVAHRKTGRLVARAAAAAVVAGIMLALAGTALARRADTPLRPVDNTPAPIVRETVLRPGTGPDTLALVLIGLGSCAALLGAGYLGARIALRMSAATPRPTGAVAAARRRRPSRTSG